MLNTEERSKNVHLQRKASVRTTARRWSPVWQICETLQNKPSPMTPSSWTCAEPQNVRKSILVSATLVYDALLWKPRKTNTIRNDHLSHPGLTILQHGLSPYAHIFMWHMHSSSLMSRCRLAWPPSSSFHLFLLPAFASVLTAGSDQTLITAKHLLCCQHSLSALTPAQELRRPPNGVLAAALTLYNQSLLGTEFSNVFQT